MRNIIIGIGVLALATLAYFALSTSTREYTAPVVTSDSDVDQQSRASPDKPSRDRFVTPRRMRSESALPSDKVSGDSRRRMREMGRAANGSNLRANRIKGLKGSGQPSEEERSARQATRNEVMARRVGQWISDADKDADGLLSRSEAELGSSSLRLVLSDFDSADSNGDGAIDEEELRGAVATRRAARQRERAGR